MAAKRSRADLTIALRDVFRERGWDGASLSDLSAATGLNRASLYHHFPRGKADMAAAALADVEARLQQEMLAPLAGSGSPRERLAGMEAALSAFFHGGEIGCLLGALSKGQTEHGLGPRVADAFEAWVAALQTLACEEGIAPARARQNALAVVVAVEGALVVATATGAPEAFVETLRRLPELLFAPAPIGD